MSRYVFSLPTLKPDPRVVAAAEQIARELGATVLRKAAGSLLLDAAPGVAAKLAKAMPDWRLDREQSYRTPERTPLQRAKLAAAGKA